MTKPLGDGLDADFRLRGKIGVRGEANTGGAFSASFDWVQAGEGYAIELWGPFGQGRTRLRGDGRSVTITDAHGATMAGETPEALMRQQLGWSAPVGAVRHWVFGRPDPGHRATGQHHATDGRLERFEQLGWTVALSRWREGEPDPLPGKIIATSEGQRITIICKEWLFD